MAGRKLFVIVDHRSASRFFIDTLDAVEGYDAVTVLNCTNTSIRKRLFTHLGYYALNLLTIRNPQTRYVPISASRKTITEVIDFESIYEGAWQKLPPEIIARIVRDQPDAVLKFGMSLMRIPPELTAPVLSFHHGDPDAYRGRPAGFYETLHGRPTVGQIIQVLSNRLDAGAVVAFGETKVYPHSYRATLIDAYRHSPLLINAALRNVAAGTVLPKASKGTNYRLPSNLLVARFCLTMAARFVRRLVYGALFEKEWRVSTAPLDGADLAAGQFPAPARWTDLPRLPRYAFYADPFFSIRPPGMLVEALSRATGKGEIVLATDAGQAAVSEPGGHYSYPGAVEEGGERFIVPETAQWSGPRAWRLRDGRMVDGRVLDIEGEPRVLDPTFVRHDGRLYLFGNLRDRGGQALYLWSADSLFDRFTPHPMNPVRVSPRGARMAGGFLTSPRGLVRFGQSYLGDYGDGVFGFAVETLSPTAYRERETGELRFSDVRGPHTLNLSDGVVLFDWYRNRFSLLAGWRRWRGRAP